MIYKFASRVLLFQDALIYQNAIELCYSRQTMVLYSHISSPRTWAIFEVMVNVLSLIVTSYVLNQSCRHYLFRDMLQYVINKTYKVRDELINVVVHNSLGDPKANAFDVELTKLIIRMKL